MRNKTDKRLKQKSKKRLSIFVRPDQWEALTAIRDEEDTFMLDVIEDLLDLGLKVYFDDANFGSVVTNKTIIDTNYHLYD